MDVFESLFVEGMVLAVDDLYEGMVILVLTSLSGYPIKIHVNPLRANDVIFEMEGFVTHSTRTELSTSFPNFRILSFLGKESRYSMCYSS
jgi:hypothetical protein